MSIMTAASAYAEDPETVAEIMGGSGTPIPPANYLSFAYGVLHPKFPQLDPGDVHGLFTPEGFYPVTGVKTLPFDTSVAQGVTILNDTINQQIADGHNVIVGGGSQSVTIESMEMARLAALPPDEQPSPGQLSFFGVGDPDAPNGGLLERFDGLTLPSLGITFSGATPPDTIYPTDIYTLEYDGIADFPQYPLNLLSDLNAVLGFALVHPTYPDLPPSTYEPVADGGQAILLPGSADLPDGTGATDYWMIPTATLPLLQPLQSIPVIGQPLYDLLEPDTRILVNLGYGSITDGWSQGPANVPTEFGLFPTNISPSEVLAALANGAQHGVQNFIDDLSNLSPSTMSLPDLSDLLTLNPAADLSTTPTDIVNALTAAFSTAYATLLPTADIAVAIGDSLPAYDAGLVMSGLEAGNLLDAVGDPIAANTGLVAFGAGIEVVTLVRSVEDIISDFSGLFP
jgi:hypothetical protein